MVAEADYRIKLPVFEGPLDLLLFLIRKSELDIYDIPISTVTKQYLEVIYAMKELQIEVAGEFFVMAATLMEIKSRMLLPKHQQAVDLNAEEDDLDPRWELVHQLLQYKKFKEAAGNLNQMSLDAANMLSRPAGSAFAPSSERPLKHVDRIEVWNSFNLILRRLAEKLVVGENPSRTDHGRRPDGIPARAYQDAEVLRVFPAFRRKDHAAQAGRHVPRRSRIDPLEETPR